MVVKELIELKDQIKKLLEKGCICPSSPSWGAPVIFTPKKDGTQWICVYYRALNEVTIENEYLLPRIDDLFDQLHRVCVCSIKLIFDWDRISWRYKNMTLWRLSSFWGMVHMSICWCLLDWLILPAYSMDLIDKIYMEYLNKFIIVFIDGIMVSSKSEEEHEEHFCLVLQKLWDHRPYAKLSKCEFWMKQVLFLSHVISEDRISWIQARFEMC
jgi:hypothetical protein